MYVFHGGMVYLHTRDGGKGFGHWGTSPQLFGRYVNPIPIRRGIISPPYSLPYFLENSAVPAYRYKYNSLVFAKKP